MRVLGSPLTKILDVLKFGSEAMGSNAVVPDLVFLQYAFFPSIMWINMATKFAVDASL